MCHAASLEWIEITKCKGVKKLIHRNHYRSLQNRLIVALITWFDVSPDAMMMSRRMESNNWCDIRILLLKVLNAATLK